MKYSLVLVSLLGSLLFAQGNNANCTPKNQAPQNTNAMGVQQGQSNLLRKNSTIIVSVVGQGVAPANTISPAQAYALAKRAAIADGYRALGEKLQGVRVEGQDIVKNMMMQRSTISTQVDAIIRNANIVETQFKDGLCEVEMEVTLSYSDFS